MTIRNFLQTLERETFAEIALLTVDSSEDMTIEEYANRLLAEWDRQRRYLISGF